MKGVKVAFAGLLVIMTLLAMIAPAHAANVTITPSSADTYVSSTFATDNFGGPTVHGMFVCSGGTGVDQRRVLVKFDLSSIPSGISTVNLAYLQLYYANNYATDAAGRTHIVNQVTTNWVEGDGTAGGGGTMGATWNKPDKAFAPTWTTAGGDFTATGAASNIVPAMGNWMTWDVTAIVKAWIESGQPNYGFLIKDSTEGTSGTAYGAGYYSKEAGSLMPILKIDYTVRTTIIPEYPLGLPLLAIFMIIAYGLIKRRTQNPKDLRQMSRPSDGL